MRKLLALLLVVVLAGVGWWMSGTPLPAFLGQDGPAGQPRLRLAEVDRGPITAVVAATGTVNPVTLVQVGSQLSGQIRELLADFNTQVRAEQPLSLIHI